MAAVEAISTTYMEASGAEASYIIWDDIPSSYEHLEIRMSCQTVRALYGNDAVYMRLGDTGDSPVDTSTNYSYSTLESDGTTTPFQNAATGINVPRIARITSSVKASTSNFGVAVIQILDYANANKNTTVMGFGGNVTDGGTSANFVSVTQNSVLWSSTTVVNAIHLLPADGTVWTRGSVFTLYGWNSS